MIALYPNATHLIQLMDVAVFHTLKTAWRQEVANFRMNHEGIQLQNCHFPRVLEAALQHVTPETIINGFSACGLVPWDPKKIIVRKKKDEDITPPTQKRHREIVTFFKILEEKIGKDKLVAYEANVGEWSGPIEQTDLYNLWAETKETLKSYAPLRNIEQHSQVALVNYVETRDNKANVVHEQESPLLVNDLFSGSSNTCETVAGSSNIVNKLESLVPREDSFSEVLNRYRSAAEPSNVPSPFKRALFWPEDKKSKVKRRRTREKLPAVVTSPQMIQYFKKKDEEKKMTEALKEQRQIEREEKRKAAEQKKGKKKD